MARSKRTLELLAVSLLAASSLWAGVRAEKPEHRSLMVVPDGPVETVFEWARDACAKNNVPDAPARAFRGASGQVSLVVSHNDNRALVGPDLDGVRPKCSMLYEGKRSARLSDFDDLSWIGGVYTRDGTTVYALAHTELRGERTPDQCPAGRYSPCLLNTITALVSRDGGQSFQPLEVSRPPVVATLPYGFPTDRNGRVGYANPSNIIEHEGWFYAFIFADGYKAQRRGNCLIRTKDLDDPFSWRAWNGTDFSAEFVDPFRQSVENPGAHVCAPVAPNAIGRMIGSMVKHRESGKVLAVFGDRRRNLEGRWVEGIFASTSSDLLTWSDASLVMEAQLLWDKSCNELHAYFYPSLIDPGARTPSFEDIGERGFLYLTRYQLKNCAVTWDRDLVRIPVTIQVE
ncbi:hypothetical protein [Microvirga terricola]|uniref:DUF4185 domain-containing protein n=1 Tax=Microvirga terricola TaxID=2719797 RepID=A0ABX0VID2_9HYPH|nr:hypothetical protein [Microvirga terricola]NIX78342.1 hypothetical protein [Microvirga terricola]